MGLLSLSSPPSLYFVGSTDSSQPDASRWLRSSSQVLTGAAPAPRMSTKVMPKAKMPLAMSTTGPVSSRQRSPTDTSRGGGRQPVAAKGRLFGSLVMADTLARHGFLGHPFIRRPPGRIVEATPNLHTSSDGSP